MDHPTSKHREEAPAQTSAVLTREDMREAGSPGRPKPTCDGPAATPKAGAPAVAVAVAVAEDPPLDLGVNLDLSGLEARAGEGDRTDAEKRHLKQKGAQEAL